MHPVRITIGETLSETFRVFFGNLPLFWYLVTIPWIASVAIRVIGAMLASEDSFIAFALIEKAVDVIPTTMFLIAWMRAVLIGPQSIAVLPGLGWSGRETAYLTHMIKIFGITFMLIAGFALTVGSIDPASLTAGPSANPELAQRQALATPLGFGFIVSGLIALRVSYGLAATAADVAFTPRESWLYGRGNGWPIVGTLFLLLAINALVTAAAALFGLVIMRGIAGPGLGSAVVSWTFASLVAYAGAALVATAQAIMFRELCRFRAGSPLGPPP